MSQSDNQQPDTDSTAPIDQHTDLDSEDVDENQGDAKSLTRTPGIDQETPANGRLVPRRDFVIEHPPGTKVLLTDDRGREWGPYRVSDAYTHGGHVDEDPEDGVTIVDERGKSGYVSLHNGRLTASPAGRYLTLDEDLTVERIDPDVPALTEDIPAVDNGWERVAAHPSYLAWAGAFSDASIPTVSGMGRRDVVEVVKFNDHWRARTGNRSERDWNANSWTYFPGEHDTRAEAVAQCQRWFDDHPISEEAAARDRDDVTAPPLEAQL